MQPISSIEALVTLGVLLSSITLVYLVVQIRHNRRAIEAAVQAAQTKALVDKVRCEDKWMQGWNDALADIYGSADKINLMSRGLANDPALTDVEYVQFSLQMIKILNHHQISLQMAEHNARDPHSHKIMEDFVLMILTSPGGSQWWHAAGWTTAQYAYLNKTLKQGVDVPSYPEWEASLFSRNS